MCMKLRGESEAVVITLGGVCDQDADGDRHLGPGGSLMPFSPNLHPAPLPNWWPS